jgi:RHS repeat-associated protein
MPGYAFTGREWDPEIGLYYYRARYYDPRLGRFISEDPIGFAGGVDQYAYVGNQPVNGWDPLGLVDFSGNADAVKLAYAQQDRLRGDVAKNQNVLDFFKKVFDADLIEYLTPGKNGTFPLKDKGRGATGHCNNNWLLPLDADPWINTSYDLFGDDGLLFRATLLHELAHLANRNDFWDGSYSYDAEVMRRADAGRKANPLVIETIEGYYAEALQFGRVITSYGRMK